MPKLPDATDLNPVAPQAAMGFTNIPVADYAALGAGLGRAANSTSDAAYGFGMQEKQRAQAQERFDTKMGLLKAEQDYYDKTKDLDPLDPQYVAKKQQLRKDTFGPVLSAVKDPENKQLFDSSTYEDYVQLGIKAQEEQKAAFGKDAEIKVGTYVDDVRKRVLDGTYKGDPVADVAQTIKDNQHLDDLQKEGLTIEKLKVLNGDIVDAEFKGLASKGISVTPEVQKAIDIATAQPGTPAWMPDYLARSATLESAGGRNKVNPNNPAHIGTWQFDEATARGVGLNPGLRTDDNASAQGAVKLAMENFNALKAALGRDPTPGEIYLAHQQGAPKAIELLKNPDAKASSVVGQTAVEGNLPASMKDGASSMTAGQFAQMWVGKFENTGGKVDPDAAMSIIKQGKAYQSLDPEARAQADANIRARAKLYNDEYQKQYEQNVADGIVQSAVVKDTFGNEVIDPGKAHAAVSAIGDVDTRKAAGELVDLQLRRQEADQKAALGEHWDATASSVDMRLKANDPVSAKKIIDASKLPQDKKDALYEKVKKGSAKTDDPATYHKLVTLYYDKDPTKFLQATDDPATFTNKLTDDTLLKVKGWRDEIKKAQNGDNKSTNLRTIVSSAGGKINDKLREIGVDPNAKVGEADARYAGLIRDITERTIEAKLADKAKKGEQILDSEINDIVNGVFKNYPVKVENYYGLAGYFGMTPGTYTVSSNIADALKGAAGQYQNEGLDIEAAVLSLRKKGIPVTADNLTSLIPLLKGNQ